MTPADATPRERGTPPHDLCAARDGKNPGACVLYAGHAGDHLRVSAFGMRVSFARPAETPPAAEPPGVADVIAFNHFHLNEPHWEPGIGPCICRHCAELRQADAERRAAAPPTGHATAETGDDDATNLRGLITMCEDLKRRLVPYGATEAGWDSAIDTLRRAESACARASQAEALLDVYRNLCAAELGYTLIPEDTTVRPQSMSYVKPSEFDDLLAHRIEEAMSRAPSTGTTP